MANKHNIFIAQQAANIKKKMGSIHRKLIIIKTRNAKHHQQQEANIQNNNKIMYK